jgi:hypothetical protein
MAMQDVFTGGLTGLTQGLVVGNQLFGGLAERRATAAKNAQVMQLQLLEAKGKILQSAITAMKQRPTERKLLLTALSEQLAQVQTIAGESPTGLGPTFIELAAKADDARAPLYAAMLEGRGLAYLKGDPAALRFLDNPIEFITTLQTAQTKREELEHAKTMGQFFRDEWGRATAPALPGAPSPAGPLPLPAGAPPPGTMGGVLSGGIASGRVGVPLAEQPPFALAGGMRVVPPPAGLPPTPEEGAAMGMPTTVAPAPAAPAPKFRRTLNLTSEGKGSLSLSEQEPNLGTQFVDIPLPNGMIQRARVVTDPRTGAVVSREPIGVPQAPEALQALRRQAQGLGYALDTSEGEAAVQQLSLLPLLPDHAKATLLEQLQAKARGPGGGVSISGAIETGRQRQIDEKVTEASRIKEATEARDPIGAEQQGIIGPQTAAITGLTRVLRDYEKDIPQFAGLWNKTLEEGKAALGGLGQAVGIGSGQINERFQAFKADVASIRQVIQNAITGKTMTPFEGESIAAMIPTGAEPGGPAEFRVKLAKALQMLQTSREIRLELARTGKGQINLDELDARLRQKFGGGSPRVGGDPGGAPSEVFRRRVYDPQTDTFR